MAIYKSTINIDTENFEKNKSEMISLVNKMHDIKSRAEKISERRRPRFIERGQLTPRERLFALLDPEMPFVELYNMISYLVDDENHGTSIPGGSIIAGIGFVCGVRCLVFVDDSGINAGALTAKSIDKALGCLDISMKQKLPFIHLVESAGINLMNYTVEFWARTGGMFNGLAKLSAAGIPTIAVLHGLSTAGGAYQPGMSDYVVGVKKNGMAALAGPALLKAATGQIADNEELGGSEMHARVTGLVEYLADDDSQAIEITRDIVEKLDWNSKCEKRREVSFSKPIYDSSEIAGVVPVNYRIPYEVREVIARIVDGSDFIDFKPMYGVSTVCIQAKIYGYSCGIIGNNGPIDPNGATKAAQFIQLCGQSKIPLIFFSNTTGFMVGKQYEQLGMIKHGSKMIQAVSNVDVPKITFYIGASFGAGNYAMCGYAYEPDFLFSWPNSVTGVMGGEQAAKTMEQVMVASANRKGIKSDEVKMKKQVKEITEYYNSQSDAFCTSGRGLDNGIIDPRDTRKILEFILQTCWEKSHRKLSPNTFGIARM
jgi:geranyl-CoA carboxylase beta subunit